MRQDARTFFYPANKHARQSGDNSRLYCPRISPFQATPIFATKLLGYSTLAGLWFWRRRRAHVPEERKDQRHSRDSVVRSHSQKADLNDLLAPRRIDDKIEERRPRARRRPALKSTKGFGFIVSAATRCPVQRKRKLNWKTVSAASVSCHYASLTWQWTESQRRRPARRADGSV